MPQQRRSPSATTPKSTGTKKSSTSGGRSPVKERALPDLKAVPEVPGLAGPQERDPAEEAGDATIKEEELWERFERPPRAEKPQSNLFCLRDEGASQAAERALSCAVVTDPGSKGNPITSFGPGVARVSGHSHEDIQGRNPGILIAAHAEDGEASRFYEALAAHSTEPARVELPLCRKDGSSFSAAIQVGPIKEQSGQRVVAVMMLVFDISEQRKSGEPYGGNSKEESKLEQAGLSTEGLLESLAIIEPRQGSCAGPGHRLAHCGEEFLDLIGMELEDAENRHWACWLGPGADRETVQGLAAGMRKGEEQQGAILGAKHDGTPFWCFARFMPLQGLSRGVLAVVNCTSFKPGRVGGRYHIGRVLGRGSFGVVRVGMKPGTNEMVAVKSLDCSRFRSLEEVDQLQGEIKVMEHLSHPNVVRLHDVIFVQEKLLMHLVVDYASAGSLDKVIHESPKGHLEESRAANLFQQFTSALAFCHRRRIVHRDLKPENLLLDDEGLLKVADFGLSTITSPFAANGLESHVGTPAFIAPEVIKGSGHFGPPIDMWAAGVILYEMLVGKLPFTKTSDISLERRICSGRYSLPSSLSAKAAELIRSLLHLEPNERLTSDQAATSDWVRAHVDIHDANGGDR